MKISDWDNMREFALNRKAEKSLKITAKMLKACTGFNADSEDLKRCNCKKGGALGHRFCGWNFKAHRPNYFCGLTLRTIHDKKIYHAELNRTTPTRL